MSKNSMSMKIDMSELAQFVGSGEGWVDSFKTPYYISDIIAASHGVATVQFNKDAAENARAMNFTHMFEWGASGINKGDVPLNPLSRAARLWTHRLTGRGRNRGIDFTFRNSYEKVPVPSLKFPNGKSLVSKHIFHNKAMVTELGIPVHIAPKKPGGVLVIPLNGEKSTMGESLRYGGRANKRGYAITPYPVTVPGSSNAGNFLNYWRIWWNSIGKEVMDERATLIVNGDAEAVIKVGRGRGSALRTYSGGRSPMQSFNVQVEAARALANAEMKIRESKLKSWQVEDAESNISSLAGRL